MGGTQLAVAKLAKLLFGDEEEPTAAGAGGVKSLELVG